MRFSDASLRALPTPESGQRLYTDDSLPGFGLRVSRKAKTFVLTHGSDRQRLTLGRYGVVSLSAARERARTILAEKQLGIVHKPSPSFAVVKDEYLDRRDGEVRASTRRADDYLFKHFEGLGKRKLADITPEMIEAILDGIDAHSTRRSAFLRISGVFSYAVRRGYVGRSPVAPLKVPESETPRHRVLTRQELAKVLTTARMMRLAGDHYGAIVELLILTGQRRQQIAALHPSMVDFQAGVIEWGPEHMKTGRRHIIPLGAAVREILEPRRSSGLYFSNRIGEPFCGWSYHFRKFTAEIGFADFVLHDLRRTLATCWQEMGIEIATTEKMLAHSAITGGLVGVYQRSSYLAQMRDALQKWEVRLHALLQNYGG